MKYIVLIALVLLMIAGGCLTIDLGGSNKAPSIIKFVASPAAINVGEASLLSWEVENASSVKIDPGMTTVPSIGTDKVVPTTTTTYVLTATNKSGSTKSQIQITVGNSATTPPSATTAGPVILSFYSSPSSVNAGSSALLTWTTTNATGAKISDIGNVAASGSQMIYPSSTTTYTLEVYNDAQSTSASITVAVVPLSATPPASASVPTILSFTASPSAVVPGGSAVLSWNISNATSASIDGHGPVPVSGSLNVYPSGTGTITFNLRATNSAGNSYASTSIVVSSAYTPPSPSGSPPAATLYVSPSSIAAGGSATLTWVTSGATSVSINNGVKSLTGISGASGSVSVSPTSTTTYTLTASNAYGSTQFSQVLTVSAAPSGSPPTAALYLSQSNIPAGGSATLTWATAGATSVSINNGVKSLTGVSGASGSITVSPTTTTTYTLTATNSYGSNYASKVLTVH